MLIYNNKNMNLIDHNTENHAFQLFSLFCQHTSTNSYSSCYSGQKKIPLKELIINNRNIEKSFCRICRLADHAQFYRRVGPLISRRHCRLAQYERGHRRK